MKLQKPPSGTLDIEKVVYPCLASIKYDGFRVAIKESITVLNSGREVDNIYTRQMLMNTPELEGHDGELVMLPLTDNKCFNRCQSAFTAVHGEPSFTLVVFDRINTQTFEDRWVNFEKPNYPSWVMVDVPVLIHNREQLDKYVEEVVGAGHEGVILRQANSYYKHGRATMKSQEVLRIKPMEDDEAVIVGFECEYENINEAEKDAHGHTKRSSAKDGKVAKDTLGKLICLHKVWGELKISGFDDLTADEIWNNKDRYLSKLATFRYQKHGTLDKPRVLKFKGIRHQSDMS